MLLLQSSPRSCVSFSRSCGLQSELQLKLKARVEAEIIQSRAALLQTADLYAEQDLPSGPDPSTCCSYSDCVVHECAHCIVFLFAV